VSAGGAATPADGGLSASNQRQQRFMRFLPPSWGMRRASAEPIERSGGAFGPTQGERRRVPRRGEGGFHGSNQLKWTPYFESAKMSSHAEPAAGRPVPSPRSPSPPSPEPADVPSPRPQFRCSVVGLTCRGASVWLYELPRPSTPFGRSGFRPTRRPLAVVSDSTPILCRPRS